MIRSIPRVRIIGFAAMLLSSLPLVAACAPSDADDATSQSNSSVTAASTGGAPSTSTAATDQDATVGDPTVGDPTGDVPTGDAASGGGGSSPTTGATDSGEDSTTGGGTTTDGSTGIDTTGDPPTPGVPVDLGTAKDYVILAKTAISTVPASAITGDLGISPAAATYITGFSLIADPSNVFSTSQQVTGKVFAADYAVPTPSNLTTAVGDMELAFSEAAARTPDVIELGAGDIGGMTLPAGVYNWSTSLLIPTDITLDGDAKDVWIFQVAGDLMIADAVEIALTADALPRSVFWQVSGLVHLGPAAHLEGVVLAQTSVTLESGASLRGRLLAQTAVTLAASTIVAPVQ